MEIYDDINFKYYEKWIIYNHLKKCCDVIILRAGWIAKVLLKNLKCCENETIFLICIFLSISRECRINVTVDLILPT